MDYSPFKLHSPHEDNHNQPTWGLFVDLVKAIQIMYEHMYITKLTLGKEEQNIPYTTGMQHGDNMVPLLFLFIMQAFSEILESKWTSEQTLWHNLPSLEYMNALILQ